MSDYPTENTETSSVVYIDFAGGWRYGFPRVLTRDNSRMALVDWLVSVGVPDWLAQQEANHLRIWSVPAGASTKDFLPVTEKR